MVPRAGVWGFCGEQCVFLKNRSAALEGASRCRIAIYEGMMTGVAWTEVSQEHPTPQNKKKGFAD